VTKYFVRHADGTVNEMKSREHRSDLPYRDGGVVATTTTGDNGEFSFSFLSNSKGEPLENTDCTTQVAQRDGAPFLQDDQLFADNGYRPGRGGPNPGETGVTGGVSGDNACQLYEGFTIGIEGEHARYYLNPDQVTAYFFEVKGGETKDVGEVVSLVRTIDLNVKVIGETSNLTINAKEELANMNVFLFRKISFDYPSLFPAGDVTPDKTDNFPAPVAAMECVGKGLTDQDGVAKISSLVLSDNPTYQYYLYINNTQDYNYESDAPLRIDFAELLKADLSSTPGPGGMPNIDMSTPGYESMRDNRSAFTYFSSSYSSIANGFDLEVALKVQYPSLRVILQEPDGLKKLEQPAQVTLTEKYSAGHAMASPSVFEALQLNRVVSTPMAYYDTGIYEHRDAAVELASAPTRIVGPERTVTVKTAGFADTTFTVKEGDPLKMGERFEMLIKLRYGALFTGTVIDAETREPLPNTAVKILGEMSKVSTTGNDGSYTIEARKLSGLRAVEVSRAGYLTDTVNVQLNKDNNVYHFELYRKTRRLRVEVWAKNDYREGIVVSLPDVPVSWKTDYGSLPGGSSAGGNAGGLLPGSGQQITVPQGALTQGTLPQGSTPQGTVTITQGVVARKIKPPSSPQAPPAGQSSKSKLTEKSASAQLSAATPGIGAAQLLQQESQESQEYHLVTGSDGVADFAFEGGQGDRFRVVLTNTPGATEHFPRVIREVELPYAKDYMGTVLRVVLEEGSCLTGAVYLGDGEQPAAGRHRRDGYHHGGGGSLHPGHDDRRRRAVQPLQPARGQALQAAGEHRQGGQQLRGLPERPVPHRQGRHGLSDGGLPHAVGGRGGPLHLPGVPLRTYRLRRPVRRLGAAHRHHHAAGKQSLQRAANRYQQREDDKERCEEQQRRRAAAARHTALRDR